MEQEANLNRVPPYVAFRSVKTLIEDMRTQGYPSHVDKDVMKRFSGSVRSQLTTALRFLGLINDANETTTRLEILVESKSPEEWKAALKSLLEDTYGSLLELPLPQMTPTALAKEFKERYKAKDEVIEKCVRFFVHAAKEAGIELSKRITDASRSRAPRRAGTVTKKQDATDAGDNSIAEREKTPPPKPHGSERTVQLNSGAGSVTLSLDVDLLELEEGADRVFVFDLIDKLRAYEKGATVSTAKTNKVEKEAGE